LASKRKSDQFEFRVIAGLLKGKIVRAPKLAGTRPPLTRLRKSIFDFLNPFIRDARYLDLFSGTGSYLFEAISRGAMEATGTELDLRLVRSINDHAERYEVADKLRCLKEDVFDAIARLHEAGAKFDIVMMAPPQYQGLIDQALVKLNECPILADDGMILAQHDSSETKDIDFSLFEIDQQRKYGNTTFTILSYKPRAGGDNR